MKIDVDEKTYSLEKMTEFVKKRLDEITKVNLYDIGLSEEELKRRKNKKYELKKALKGCTYGDVHDKRYVKTLIYDLLLPLTKPQGRRRCCKSSPRRRPLL